MKGYTFYDPEQGTIRYTDRKRYLWMLASLFPLLPLLSIWMVQRSGVDALVWLPFVVVYGLVPLLDYWFPNDHSNPPEQIVPQLEADPYYRILNHLTVALTFLALGVGAWFVATHDMVWFNYLGLSIAVGIIGAFGINIGHELGHKKNRFDRLMARLALSVTGYGHFNIEHNIGHHVQVATPEDSASARMGESIYKFSLREIPGGVRRALRLEKQRLRRRGKKFFSPANEVLQSWLFSVVLYVILIAVFGWQVAPFLLIQAACAWWMLTSANYIEHYGLLRQKRPDGRYERCQPRHSWNANHLASNILSFHLERHSDHHAYAARHYQSLRHHENVPQLPAGYFGMFLLAYIPSLWRRVMDPRVMAEAGQDLSRINLDPDKAKFYTTGGG